MITEELYQQFNDSLPQRFKEGDHPSGIKSSNASIAPSHHTPELSRQTSSNHEVAEALYDFSPQEQDDVGFRRGDKVQILEKPSADWWKGSVDGRVGMFPSNYVKPLNNEKQSVAAPPSFEQAQMYQPPMQSQQPPFPPQSTNYYPPQQPQPVPAEQAHHHGKHFKKFGSKLGNAAVFGAGATIGSDLVNSIF